MAKKISWFAPVSTVTAVEINRAGTKYGAYTALGTVSGVSTTYTDSTGTRTHWYKVRFVKGTSSPSYSGYSQPITSSESTYLCVIDDIKRVIDTSGRWTDKEVEEMIKETEDMIYVEYGTPIQSTISTIGKIDDAYQKIYYVGEENIYRVDRLFYGTQTKSELFLDDAFLVSPDYGLIKFIDSTTSGVSLSTDNDVEIRYVPMIFHQLAVYKTAQALLETQDTISGGKPSKELLVINSRLATIEKLLNHRFGMAITSQFQYYDSTYGTNTKTLIQDFRRNNVIGSYAFSTTDL
jgi:hypothetical protein